MEALTEFSHIYYPEGLNNTLISQGCACEKGSNCGNDGQHVHSKEGQEVGSLPLPKSSSLVNRRSDPLCDLLQRDPCDHLMLKVKGHTGS